MDSSQFTFTLARLKALKPKATPYIVKDTTVPLLQAKVNPGSGITFQIRKRPRGSSRVVCVTLAKLSDGISINRIREMAIHTISQLNDGINPNEEAKKRAKEADIIALTLREAFEAYANGKRNARTGKSLTALVRQDYTGYMQRFFSDWAERPMLDITPTMVVERYDTIHAGSGPILAARAIALIRSVWNFTNDSTDDDEPLYGLAPFRKLNKLRPGWNKSPARDRRVKPDELPTWLNAVREEGGIPAAYLEVLILTGLRRNELSGMRWDEVDMRRRVMTFPRTKNGKTLQLPITKRVMELLRWSRKANPHAAMPFKLHEPRYAAERIEKRTGIKFSPHDLRRSFTVFANGAGVGDITIKRILNHSSKKDVTFTHYGHLDVDDLREPLQTVEDFILRKAGVASNVLEVVK